MSLLEGPFAAACALLVLAGAYKTVRPSPTSGALKGVRWPSGTVLVRALGLGEILLGTAALVTANRVLALLVGVAYLGFTAFVLVALREGSAIQSCGCFGETETPPSLLHVVADLALSGAALAVSIGGAKPLLDVLADQPAAGIPFVVLVAVTVQLVRALLTDLPRALQVSAS